MIKAIIFDLDGVLLSTDEYHYRAWKTIADAEGIAFDRTVNDRLRGVSRMESLEIILEKANKRYDEEAKIRMAEEKNGIYRRMLGELTPSAVTDEVKNTLTTLKSRGYRIAIGSSSKNARFILEKVGLIDEFDAISDGNCITRSKPDPEVFIVAAKKLGCGTEECVVVEDSVAGIKAAKIGGFASVAIGDAAEHADADYKIYSFSQLLDICGENDLWRDIYAFDTPSADFAGIAAALPFGNGYMGAQVEDNLVFESITLNESTLFTGAPYENHIDGAYKKLGDLRKRTLAGEPCDVEWGANFVGMFGGQIFEPAGTIIVHTDVLKGTSGYRKQIDMRNGVLTTTFEEDGIFFKKTYFASYPRNVIVLSYKNDGKRNYTFEYLSKTDGNCSFPKNDEMVFIGKANGCKGVDGTIRYVVAYKIDTDGKIDIVRNKTRVVGSSYCNVYLSVKTDYVPGGGRQDGFVKLAEKTIENACKAGVEKLVAEHSADFSAEYGKTGIKLAEKCSGKTVNALMCDYATDKNKEFVEKIFNFDKYLIISSTRKNSQPPTLQGKWNAGCTPPWDCKYTVNINLEMNYWSVGALDLCENAEPLFDKIDELLVHGKKTARELYGIDRGDSWVMHHNTDLWNECGAIDGPWGLTPVCGAWLVNTAYDFWLYTKDEKYLKRIYKALKGATEFFTEFLIDVESEGKTYKTTCPSTSPERPNGKQGYVSYGSTHDSQMIRQLFENYLVAAELLDSDEYLKNKVKRIMAQLPPPAAISSSGVLKEFYFHDNDSADDTHRHLSHLYGLHPGRVMHVDGNEEWLKAAEYTLDRRSREGDWAGWGIVWRIYMYSRLHCADKALKMLDLLLNTASGLLLPNGFAAHPYECGKVFQYDANAGFPGALIEMFVSCPKDVINLLGALPERFNTGAIYGIRTYGAFVVKKLEFKDGKITDCIILSEVGGTLKVTVGEKTFEQVTLAGERFSVTSDGIKKI